MVDIVFLLLIFLVLSTPFVLQPGFGMMELPVASGSTSSSLQELVVTVSRDNLVFYNAKPTTWDALPEQLRRAAVDVRNPELVLKIDRQVSYDVVIRVFDLAFESGISAVNLATRPAVPVLPAE